MDIPRRRFSDPISAMRELEDLHRMYYVAATVDEWVEYRKSHPDYAGGMPLFVEDNLAHCRFVTSKYGEEKYHELFRAIPDAYRNSLLDYVRQFPMDDE